MSSKEARLRKRLDDLESELKSLHVHVVTKRRPVQSDNTQQNNKNENEKMGSSTAKNQASKPINKRKAKSWEEKDQLLVKDDCWAFLRNISKNIAKGTEAINKIASFTEISSLTGRGDCKNPFENVYQQANKDFQEKWSGDHENKFNQNKKSIEKPRKKLHFSQTVVQKPATPPTRERNFSSEVEALKFEMEERLLDLQILKEKIENIKKRLRDERSKREIAEKALAGYKKRLAVLEGKKLKEEHKEGSDCQSGTKQEKITSAELELKSEIKRRTDAENRIKELEISLEESRNEISKIEDSRRLALAMVDRYRDHICHHNPHELENLRAEKVALQEEIKQIQHRAENVLVEKLVERTEHELIEKMKQCNSIIARGSINDPDVQEIIQHHKTAYAELEIELEHKEAELENQHAAFVKELEEVKFLSEKKYQELSDKYKQAKSTWQEKQSIIDKLLAEKCLLEKEIIDLTKQLQDITKTNGGLQSEISSLKGDLIKKEEDIEKLRTELEGRKELHCNLEEKCNNLMNVANDREKTIELLRQELEKEKDTVKIKEKMLHDQIDTMKCLRTVSENTKKTLDDERCQKRKLREELDKMQLSHNGLLSKLSKLEKHLKENEELQLTLKKSNESLKLHESQVTSKQEVLLNRLTQMTYEKDQAIQTAKFATEKLVQAINEYELKLAAQKKIQNFLNDALREKDFQLDIANQQISELNDELWKSARISEQMRSDLQSKLRKACEVCTDVLDLQFDNEI